MNKKSMVRLIGLLSALVFSTSVSAHQPRAIEADTVVEQIDLTRSRLWLRPIGSTEVYEYVWNSETLSGAILAIDISKGATIHIRYRMPFIGERRLINVEILRATVPSSQTIK